MNIKLIAFLVLCLIPMIGNARVITDNEKDCLALNVYHEGRSESTLGQFMIMDVVNNRSKSKNYPTNLCDVIKQPKQFSWYNNGWKPARNKKVLHVIRKNVDEKNTPSSEAEEFTNIDDCIDHFIALLVGFLFFNTIGTNCKQSPMAGTGDSFGPIPKFIVNAHHSC